MPRVHGDEVIKPFMCSTFRDMQTERDMCLMRSFPQVQILCEQRKVRFLQADLRWGVTAAEADEGLVIKRCLDEIDSCWPYFICVLGHRYGWSRSDGDDPSMFDEAFDVCARDHPWMLSDPSYKDRSVTELEIVHRYLHWFERRKELGMTEEDLAQKAKGIFIYFRESSPDEYTDTGVNGAKLVELKRRLDETGLGPKRYSTPEELGKLVLQDLTGLINREFPVAQKNHRMSLYAESENEHQAHDVYGYRLTSVTVAAEKSHPLLASWWRSSGGPLVVTAPSGGGKSALLARFFQRHSGSDTFKNLPLDEQEVCIVVHHVGVTPQSAQSASVIRRCICTWKVELQIGQETPDLANEQHLEAAFPSWIALAAAKGSAMRPPRKVVLALDGVERLERLPGKGLLHWLPTTLPDNFYAVMTTVPTSEESELLKARQWPVCHIAELEADDVRSYVQQYMGLYSKKLNDAQVARVLGGPMCSNPGFLTGVCSELRQYGHFDSLDQKIEQLINAESLLQLSVLILERSEEQMTVHRAQFQGVLRLLYVARNGLAADDLAQIVETTSDVLHSIVLSCTPWLQQRDGRLEVATSEMRTAIFNRYLPADSDLVAAHQAVTSHLLRPGSAPERQVEATYHLMKALSTLQELEPSPHATSRSSVTRVPSLADVPEPTAEQSAASRHTRAVLLAVVTNPEVMELHLSPAYRREFLAACRVCGTDSVLRGCEEQLAARDRAWANHARGPPLSSCSLPDWSCRVAVADYAREVAQYADAARVLLRCTGENGAGRQALPTGLSSEDLASACIKLQECYVRYQVSPSERWCKPGGSAAEVKAARLDAALALLQRAQEIMQEGGVGGCPPAATALDTRSETPAMPDNEAGVAGDGSGRILGQIAQGRGLAYLLCGGGAEHDRLAKENWETALRLRKGAGDMAAAGETMNSLGMIAMKAKQWDAAEAHLTESLRMREQALDPSHPDLAQVRHS
jgi:hypothetical protein